VCHCLRRTKERQANTKHCSQFEDRRTLWASSAAFIRKNLPRGCEQWQTKRSWAVLTLLLAASFAGCGERDSRTVVTIWHQSRPAEYELLKEEIARFEASHPDVRVRALYKETEELRSGFQAAALAGGGPELIFGPSGVPGTFQAMGVVKDMSPWFPEDSQKDFVPGALTFLPTTADPSKRAL